MNASEKNGAQPSTSSPWWQNRWLCGLLLIAAVIFAYQPAWKAGFIWDDDDYVTNNPLLTAPDGLQRIWFSTDSPSQYFPLVYTSFRLEHSLWGLNSTGYHWVNILLHAVNALLVWRLLSRLHVPGAWLGAALFALHPMQVESVAWISELKNVQSLFFFLLSLLAWIEFVEERRGFGAYALSLLFCALALLSKTTACTLPAALVLVLWFRRKPVNRARVFQILPYVAMGIAMGAVSMWWERHHQGTHGEIYAMSWLDRLLVATRASWFYLGKLLWPADLTFNYPLWKIDAGNPLAYGWLIAGLTLCAAIYFARRAAGRGVETATVFFIAMLSPLLGFIMLYTFKYTFVADHYAYVAVIGPVALAAAALTWALREKPVWLRAILGGALVLALASLTWRQSRMYHDLETLWRTTIARNPDSYMGHNNLGAILLGKGQIDDAITHFERALKILPDHGNAHGNLANALLQKGRIDEALVHFQRAVEVEPGVAKAHSDLSFGLLQKGQLDEAAAHARKALELQPGFAEAHNTLGWCLLHQGRHPEATRHFNEALRLQPGSADTHYNLGTALLHQGQNAQAITHYQRALELRPGFAKALNNLGSAYFQNGQIDQAIAQFKSALKADPSSTDASNNLGQALLQSGRLDEAIAHFRAAATASPDSPDAHYRLAVCLFQKGDVDTAIGHFTRVETLQPHNAEVRNNLGWALLQLGRTDEAIVRFRAVIELQPDFALAHNNLALAFLRQGNARDAVSAYQSFLALQPDHAPVLCDLAWLLATWPDSTIRNSTQALSLAQRANQLSGEQDANALRTLAAAFAENGQFTEAVATAHRALQLTDSSANPPLSAALTAQLKTYEAGRAFREPAEISQPPLYLRR
ncbi:MAG: tetratricopeptide repeat protein [Nibricoccus sp.]